MADENLRPDTRAIIERANPTRIPLVHPDGQEGSVAPDEYDAALKAGFQIPVVAPNGERGSVSAQEYDQALKAGFKPSKEYEETVGKMRYGGRPIAAGIAGAGRALTLGLSDLLATKTGLVAPETLHGLDEYNQAATYGGEALGIGASLLIPGLGEVSGPALAGKAGHAALHVAEHVGLAGTESVLGRLAGHLFAGGVEGTIFGLGNAVSESALGDTQLNAEKLFAHGGMGLLLGSAAGGLGGLLDEGVSAGIKAISGKLNPDGTLSEAFEDFAAKARLKQGGAIGSDMSKLTEEQRIQIGKDLEGVYKPTAGLKENFERLQGRLKEEGGKINDAIAAADKAATETGFNMNKVVERGRTLLTKLEEDPALATEARQIKKMLDGYEKVAENSTEGVTFAEAKRFDTNLRNIIKDKNITVTKRNYLADLRGIFRDEIGSQIKEVAGEEVSSAFESAMQKYGSFAEATKFGKQGLKRLAGNRMFSLTDYMSGAGLASLAGGPLGIATGALGALGNKLFRERGPGVMAEMAQKIADSPALEFMGESFQHAIKESAQKSHGILSQYAPILANAEGHHAGGALEKHLELASSSPHYRDTMALAGFPPDAPGQGKQILDRAHSLAALKMVLEEHDHTTDRHVSSLFSGSGEVRHPNETAHKTQDFGAKRQSKAAEKAHQTRMDEVSKLANNPQELVSRVGRNIGSLGQHAPGIAAGLSAAASRAVTFLNSKAPNPAPAGPLSHPWKPNPQEMAKYSRYVEAVQNPKSVLKRAAAGSITPESIEALKAVYPSLFSDIAQKAAEKLSDKSDSIPYRQKVVLSLLLGSDMDGSLNPQSIQRNQLALTGPSAKGPENQPVQPTSGGASKLTLGSRLQTPQQASASRGD